MGKKLLCIRVGETDTGTPVYFVANPESPTKSGLVDGEPVSFWSYVTRVPVTPVNATTFHKTLWNGTFDKAWNEKFWYRRTPLTKADIVAAGEFVEVVETGRTEPRPPSE